MKIYLDENTSIENTVIGLTYEGLKHMVEHYQHLLKICSPSQLDNKNRAHMLSVIERYQNHIEIYERSGKHLIDDQRRADEVQPSP